MTAYRYPDGHVFYRKLGRTFPRIVRGEGCWLIDDRGKRYLDAVGGAYVANFGHSNPDIADAMAQQARQFGYLSGTAFTHGPVEELAREHPNFRFWPTLSRPEASWTGRIGHVQEHLFEAVGERRDVNVFICGLKAMVDDVRAILKASGLERKRIMYEKYD